MQKHLLPFCCCCNGIFFLCLQISGRDNNTFPLWLQNSAAWNGDSKLQTLMPVELNQWARSKLISGWQHLTITQREFIIEEVRYLYFTDSSLKNTRTQCSQSSHPIHALINEQVSRNLLACSLGVVSKWVCETQEVLTKYTKRFFPK